MSIFHPAFAVAFSSLVYLSSDWKNENSATLGALQFTLFHGLNISFIHTTNYTSGNILIRLKAICGHFRDILYTIILANFTGQYDIRDRPFIKGNSVTMIVMLNALVSKLFFKNTNTSILELVRGKEFPGKISGILLPVLTVMPSNLTCVFCKTPNPISCKKCSPTQETYLTCLICCKTQISKVFTKGYRLKQMKVNTKKILYKSISS
ncbi:hypothetical protein EDC94DRAFT_682764 [Helicostylum pulchrum]|nr:hypothetical protein EDC94DRAFT_682764 [Helicostylum pulchrum]